MTQPAGKAMAVALAAILFFSFVGTSSSMVFKRKRGVGEIAREEKAVVPGIEPAPVKK